MKFILNTSGRYYHDIQDIEVLEKLGFTFVKNKNGYLINGNPEIEINSLDELILFGNVHGEIIISDGRIEIYDDFRK